MEESGCANPQKHRKKLFLHATKVMEITAMSAPKAVVHPWVIPPTGNGFAEKSGQHEREEKIIFGVSGKPTARASIDRQHGDFAHLLKRNRCGWYFDTRERNCSARVGRRVSARWRARTRR
jgi:hypothetical protein